MEVIQRERLPIEFHDMEKALDYVKEFLEIREGNPELYKEARENNQIGIPVFRFRRRYRHPWTATRPLRRQKGEEAGGGEGGESSRKACRNRLAELKEEGLPVEFHDIVENLNDMRLYLRIRENHPELYDEIRKEGRVGIPVFILPDGTVTNDFEAAREVARSLK